MTFPRKVAKPARSGRHRSFVLLGQCFFSFRVLLELVQRLLPPAAVVIGSNEGADIDPFPELIGAEAARWFQRHRKYYSDWELAARSLCERNAVSFIKSARPLEVIPAADALVVAGFARRVPREVLSRWGDWALNVHPSLLPQFQGPQPEAHSLLARREETGVTLHTMTTQFDNGPVRFQAAFPIDERDDVLDMERKAARWAAVGLQRLLFSQCLPTLRSSIEAPSYFGWYNRDIVLDMAHCRNAAEARLRLRLRPEGYAYFYANGRKIYPISIVEGNSPNGATSVYFQDGTVLCFREWVEEISVDTQAYHHLEGGFDTRR